MEGVQIEHLVTNVSAAATLQNGAGLSGMMADSMDETASTLNGQLEIEIPAGDRHGAIHTIQLQSPGGNTHIVEGLVVTSAGGGGGGEDGETTTLFHPGTTGHFLMPATSNHHHNHLTSSSTIVTSGSPSCEVITADSADHHILSGLQVVRVTTGENGETIFLVPSSAATDKHGEMQQVMVLQSADDMGDEHHHGAEMVEESVELNIPSPKPVLTTVKQEPGQCGTEETLHHHYTPQTLVVVTGGANAGIGTAHHPPPPALLATDQKPILSSVNGHVIDSSHNGPSDDRPKRKAALKALATRRGNAGASMASPRKQTTTPQKSPKNKNTPKVEVTLLEPKIEPGKAHQTLSIVSTTSHAPHIVQPPPPPTQRVMLASGAPIAATSKSYFLLPEDVVSESEDDERNTPVRKCVVCLRRRRFTEDIFDDATGGVNAATNKQQLLQHMDVLIAHLNIPARGKPNEVGICPFCLDALQRWHVFNCSIVKRHDTVKTSGAAYDDSPVNSEPFESRVYRNFKKISKVKEVYLSATHRHLARRHLTEKDWDFFCDHLFRFNSVKSERARELEKYITCREKLSHIFCIKCQRLVKNGKKGFAKHMKTQHPHDQILFPCDICGNQFPEKDVTSSSEDYYPHWISHFYFNTCEECGKRFPTKRGLGQHRHSVHKNRIAQWNVKSQLAAQNEDRPWKCDHCDASFKMKGALVSHRDVVHFNLKNHVCNICGEAFKSASSLRGHVRRHEGRRDYKCEVCHKEYYTYSALKGHKVVHQTARDFICGICGKAFKKKKALEEHGTLHTGVKPHRCPICGREIRVKSNLYKHMKIHKKNAELGITSARGRHSTTNNTPNPSIPVAVSSIGTPAAKITQPKTAKETAVRVKQIKLEDPLKDEPGVLHHHYQHTTSSVPTSNSTSSPIQGATAVDVVLENDMGAGEHRGPIVVSIVTDGMGGGPGNILEMDPEQQAQLLSAVTSLASSHGQTVTVATPLSNSTTSSSTAYLASPSQLQSASATTNSALSSAASQDPILGVSSTQFYNTQQFFTSLDQLQN